MTDKETIAELLKALQELVADGEANVESPSYCGYCASSAPCDSDGDPLSEIIHTTDCPLENARVIIRKVQRCGQSESKPPHQKVLLRLRRMAERMESEESRLQESYGDVVKGSVRGGLKIDAQAIRSVLAYFEPV